MQENRFLARQYQRSLLRAPSYLTSESLGAGRAGVRPAAQTDGQVFDNLHATGHARARHQIRETMI